MSTATALLADLQNQGFTVVATSEGLTVSPRSQLSPDLRAAIREHKAELIALLRADVPSEHPDPAGAAPRQSVPAEVHALAPPPAFLLIDAPIVIGSTVVVVNALGVIDPTPTSVRMIRTTVYDDDVWALLGRGEWRPFRDLRVVAPPAEASPRIERT